MKKIEETSFKELMAELEEISRVIEEEDADLEASLEKFERGLAITKELQKRLDSAEQKINKLTKNTPQE